MSTMNMSVAELNQIVKTQFEILSRKEMETLFMSTLRAVQDGKIRQRPTKEHIIQRYLGDIERGDWEENPQTITITKSQLVLDGMHRLQAAIRAKREVIFNVTRGWPENGTFHVIDAGTPRSVNQLLTMGGTKNATMKAGICRAISMCATNNCEKNALSINQIERLLHLFEKSIEAVLGMMFEAGCRNASSYVCGAIVYVHSVPKYSAATLTFADEFFNLKFTQGNPARALRKWLDNNPNRTQRLRQLRIALNALRYSIEKEQCAFLTDKSDSLQWACQLDKATADKVKAIL